MTVDSIRQALKNGELMGFTVPVLKEVGTTTTTTAAGFTKRDHPSFAQTKFGSVRWYCMTGLPGRGGAKDRDKGRVD